ncbi:MAG: hypothetical protein SVX38_15610 [Chloroflexota bacterium]|nr:hypothetical protein [Chloroflexota bacterium]
MLFNPSWFVDRKRELALFHRMLTGETDERILLVMDRGEKGKTCFLQRLVHECEQQHPQHLHLRGRNHPWPPPGEHPDRHGRRRRGLRPKEPIPRHRD